LIIPPI